MGKLSPSNLGGVLILLAMSVSLWSK